MKSYQDFNSIYLYRDFVDFRKGSNGLCSLIDHNFNLKDLDFTLFLFTNRAKNKIKALYWDNTGFALWYKSLEKNRYFWPNLEDEIMSLKPEELGRLLDGMSIIGHEKVTFSHLF